MSSPAAGATKGHGMILAGLLMGVLLAALDQTVVGTSLPRIVTDLNGFENFSALITAYLLASTVAIPLAGKFSDLYGRRPIYLLGMGVFLLGSVLCGLAGEWGAWTLPGGLVVTGMDQLILYRFVQGLGGGMIFPVAIATIADLYAPSERGRVQGLFGAVFGLSSVVGPFLGGWIVDYVHVPGVASWRWIFYVNLPVGAVALFLVHSHFPRVAARRTAPIDWAGIAAMTTLLVSVVLAIQWIGDGHAWGSPRVLGLAALALASLGVFILVEARARDSVLPLALFREPIFAVGAAASVFAGAAMFGVISFMPAYMQGVVGISATYSGAVLMPLSLTMVAGSVVSGRMMKRHGYKPFAVAGGLIAASAFVMLHFLSLQDAPPIWLAVLEMMWLGLGIGFTIQTFVVAAQNAVEKRHVGVATSGITLFRTLGATAGTAALGAILNARMRTELPAAVAASGTGPVYSEVLARPEIAGNVARVPQLLVTPEFLAAMAQVPGGAGLAFVDALKHAFGQSMATVWLVGAAVALAVFAIALMLRAKPLKGAEEYHGEGGGASASTATH